ncbi:MAG: LysR family transcriptional regulator [Pseudomonadales bacterium]|nr:LysR family transcriptional regulator [Pseudomonadales bacterium]NRA14532.1 LysR family transcriptional regulator [Oceanospirillaceae bacterium]
MNKLIEMEIFVQVVDAGSLVAAARRLRRNPSSVSKVISTLEDRLGVRLLTRTTRNITLTVAGGDFFELCKAILINIEEAEEAATDRNREPQGRLRVVGMDVCSPNILLPLVEGFLTLYPSIQIDINQAESFPNMVAADMDVALHIGEITSKGLECVKLTPSRRLICASPEYIATHGPPQSLASLAEHNCIGFISASPQFNNWELSRDGQTEKFQPSGILVASTAQLIRQAALSGWGICQLSDFIIGQDIQEGRLVVLFPEQLDIITNYVCAIYPRKKRIPKKTLAFVEYLKEQLSMGQIE